MSKLIVGQIVGRAISDINRVQNEAKLPEDIRRLQEAFMNDPWLKGQEGYASLAGAITGYRPRTTISKVSPFEIFTVISKGETRTIKSVMCMMVIGGVVYGCSTLAENAQCFDESTCRLATEEEAKTFIDQQVKSWEDGAVLSWISCKVGAQYIASFLTELDRTLPGPVAAKK